MQFPSNRTYEDLLRQAIHNSIHVVPGTARWAVVADLFGHGSTVSADLCRWAGEDPHEVISIDGNIFGEPAE